MHAILHLLEHHGYAALLGLVFLEAVGFPIPAALALVAAGAAAAWRVLHLHVVLAVGVVAAVIGDTLLFFAGRKTGWWLLGLLCRVAVSPETCIVSSAETFYKRGRMTLVIAKFIPGINTMAPPLAGSMKMRFSQFLRLDTTGAILYVGAYSLSGFLFSRILKDLFRYFETFGRAMALIAGLCVVAYVAYRVWLYWTHRVYRVVPRVLVEEIIRRQAEGEKFLIADVRSHGYYDPGTVRIKGSIRFEANNLRENMSMLPKEKPIFLYCT